MSQLLNAIQKRDLLFGVKKMSPAELCTVGQKYLVAGLLSDAVDFFYKAESLDDLMAAAKRAAEEGNAFVVIKALRLHEKDESVENLLKQCAEAAEGSGKLRYALLCFEKLEDEKNVERIQALIQNDPDIVAAREADAFLSMHQEELKEEEDYEIVEEDSES